MSNWKYTNPIPIVGGQRPDLADFASERIPAGSFENLVNMAYDKSGVLRKRAGFGQWESDLSLETIPYGLFSLYKSTGKRYRLALDTYSDHLRLHYLEVGGAWVSTIENFLPTPYRRVRGARLRGSLYLTNSEDDLCFFKDPDTYGKCGVWPPTSQPYTAFGSDPSTDATDEAGFEAGEAIEDSGFLQYCVVFLYEDPRSYDNAALYENPDPTRNENFFESPASARTDLINAHWGDGELDSNENFGYIQRGLSLTIPTNTDITGLLGANVGDRIRHRKIFRRYKRYADQIWGDWAEAQEIYTGTGATWIDVEKLPSGDRDFDTDVPPIGKLITATEDRLFMGNLKDRAVRQPSIGPGWRTAAGYSPKWPYRVRIDITDTNDKIVTRGMVEMKFTNDTAHVASKNPGHSDGAYLSGIGTLDLTTTAAQQQFCFVADDGITEIGYLVTASGASGSFWEVTFLVEIPQLHGTETIYLFYGDTVAPAYLATQWESVFHKLYATTDMLVLCDFDSEITGQFPNAFTSDGVERRLGRIVTPTGTAALLGSDGGYCDDDSGKSFSSGDCYNLAIDDTVVIADHSDTATKDIIQEEGTIQLRFRVDYLALEEGSASPNYIFGFDQSGGGIGLTGHIWNQNAGDPWYFQITDGYYDLITMANGALSNYGVVLPNLTGDMWLFISVAWGTDGVSRVYIDSTGFGGGAVTTIGYHSSGLDVAPFRKLILGDDGLGAVGYYDELVVYDHEINDETELNNNYLRRTHWENALQMEIGTVKEIYDTTEDEPIRTARPSRLTWSDRGAPDVFQVDNFRESDTGAELTGLVAFGGNVIALYYNELRILNTASPGTQALFTAVDDITQMWTLSEDRTGEIHGLGCIASDSVQVTKNHVVFYGLAGLYAFTAGGFHHLSRALDGILDAIPVCYREEIQGQVFPKMDQYWMSVPTGEETAIDQQQTSQTAIGVFGAVAPNNEKLAQSFIPRQTLLHSVTLKKTTDTGSVACDVVVSIQGNNDGEPNGITLATKTLTNTEWLAISTGYFDVELAAKLTLGETYFVILECSANSNAHHPNVGTYHISDGYLDGALFEYNDPNWVEKVGNDLYFKTNYAYHDRCYVLDIRSIGPDPDKVRWSEYCWSGDDHLDVGGFALFDDKGDSGNLLVLDAAQSKMWLYDNGYFYDDTSSNKIGASGKTGKMNFRDIALRRVMTHYQMPDYAGAGHVEQLNLKIYGDDTLLQTRTLIENGVEIGVSRGLSMEAVAFEWYEQTEYGLWLKDFQFEYRPFRRKRRS